MTSVHSRRGRLRRGRVLVRSPVSSKTPFSPVMDVFCCFGGDAEGASVCDFSFLRTIDLQLAEEGFGGAGSAFCVTSSCILRGARAWGCCPGSVLAGAGISNCRAHLALGFLGKPVLPSPPPWVSGRGRYGGRTFQRWAWVEGVKAPRNHTAVQGLQQRVLHPLIPGSSPPSQWWSRCACEGHRRGALRVRHR